MGDRLKGRVAIVTGAGRGIGRAIALELAREGASLVVNDLGTELDGSGRSGQVADQVVAEIKSSGGRAIPSSADVSSFQATREMVQSALDAFGRLDILVNNAGIVRHNWLHQMTEQEFDAVIAVHLKGTFNCIRHACLPMRQQRYGRILNISSGVGVIRGRAARRVNYAAAKGGIYGLTNIAITELGPFGITVNVLLPGPNDTRLLRRSIELARSDAEDPLSAALEGALRESVRPQPPEGLAPLAAYLCTEEAGFINGHVFYAAGNIYGWCQPIAVSRQIFKQDARWTVDELVEVAPRTLAEGLTNPQPKVP